MVEDGVHCSSKRSHKRIPRDTLAFSEVPRMQIAQTESGGNAMQSLSISLASSSL